MELFFLYIPGPEPFLSRINEFSPKNFTVDSEGKPSCDYEDCDLSETARWIILHMQRRDMKIWEIKCY